MFRIRSIIVQLGRSLRLAVGSAAGVAVDVGVELGVVVAVALAFELRTPPSLAQPAWDVACCWGLSWLLCWHRGDGAGTRPVWGWAS